LLPLFTVDYVVELRVYVTFTLRFTLHVALLRLVRLLLIYVCSVVRVATRTRARLRCLDFITGGEFWNYVVYVVVVTLRYVDLRCLRVCLHVVRFTFTTHTRVDFAHVLLLLLFTFRCCVRYVVRYVTLLLFVALLLLLLLPFVVTLLLRCCYVTLRCCSILRCCLLLLVGERYTRVVGCCCFTVYNALLYVVVAFGCYGTLLLHFTLPLLLFVVVTVFPR